MGTESYSDKNVYTISADWSTSSDWVSTLSSGTLYSMPGSYDSSITTYNISDLKNEIDDLSKRLREQEETNYQLHGHISYLDHMIQHLEEENKQMRAIVKSITESVEVEEIKI